MIPTDQSSNPSSHRFLQVAAQNRKALQCLASAPPRLVVIGNFNAGKSTLINALLGKRLLPAALKPTTGAVIRLVWGEEDRTTVRFLDGRMKTAPGTALLEEYAVIGAVGNTELVEDIQVETDASLLQSGLMIVDIPGMEDDPGRYAAIFREVMLGDVVLSVHDVGVQMPWSDLTFLREELIANGCASISIVWNKCNLLDEALQDAAVRGAVMRMQGLELRPLEPLRDWYRLDALPELRQRLAGGTPSASFRTFEEDMQEALNPDSLLLKQTRATRTATLLAAVAGMGEETIQEGGAPIVVWRDTACAAAERLLALVARSGKEAQKTARLTSLVESLRARRGNLLIQIRQVLDEVQSVRENLEQSQAAVESDRQQLQQDYAFVQSRFAEAYRRQAELSVVIGRYRKEIEVALLRSFLVRIQAVLQHLRSMADSLPEFSPQTGYQAVTGLVQTPVETWRQEKTAVNSAYQVLSPIAARLKGEVQAEIIRILGMVSEVSGANSDATGQEERSEDRRILGRVVSTVSQRLLDQEALVAAFLARMPTLDPVAMAKFKGVSRQEFLPRAESLLLATLAESETRIQAGVATVLASVEKSVLASTGNALTGIQQRWEEMLAPGQQAPPGDTERFEAALRQCREDIETLQEVYYNFQAALTTFLPLR